MKLILALIILAVSAMAQTTQINVTITVPNEVIPSILQWRRAQFVAQYTLTEAVDDSVTSLTLSGMSGVIVGRRLLIDSEEIAVTAVNGTVTVTRAAGGSSVAAHLAGATVYVLAYANNTQALTGILRQWMGGVLDQFPTQAVLDAQAAIQAQRDAIEAVKAGAIQ